MLIHLKTLAAIEVLLVIGLLLYRAALVPARRGVVDQRAVALVLLMPAVALTCHSIFIYFTFLALAVVSGARSRAELASTYILVLPLTPLLGFESAASGVYLFQLSALIFMNAGGLLGVMVTAKRTRTVSPGYDLAALLLFLLFFYIYGREGSATGVLRVFVFQFLTVAAPYLIVSRAIATRADAERFLLRFGLGGVLVAVVAVFQAGKHWVLYQAFNDALAIPVPLQSATLALRAGMLRTGGPLIDYTAGGTFLAAVLVAMPAVRPAFRAGWFWPLMAALGAGLLASQSRGAWVAALVGFCFVLAYRRRIGAMLALVAVAVLAEVIILTTTSSGKLARILGASQEATGTLVYRQNLLSRGLQEVAKHPLGGTTQKRLVDDLSELTQGQHIVDFVNSHLFVAMAAGLPLFVVWLAIWLLPIRDAWRLRRTAPDARRFLEAPAAVVVTVMVALAGTSLIDRNLTWAIVALAFAASCRHLATRQSRARPASARPGPSEWPEAGAASLANTGEPEAGTRTSALSMAGPIGR